MLRLPSYLRLIRNWERMGNKKHGEVEPRLEHIKAVVKEAGIKLTHQSLEIFRELAATKDQPNADSLFRAVQHNACPPCRSTRSTGRCGCFTTSAS